MPDAIPLPPPGKAAATALFLARIAGPGRIVGLLVLMLLVGLSEGIGLLLLVPLLQAVDGASGALLPGFVRVFEGWPLGPLLGVFVSLIALRSLAAGMQRYYGQRMAVRVVNLLRNRAVRGLLRAEWRYLGATTQATSRALLITAIEQVTVVFFMVLNMLAMAINLALLLGAALLLSWQLALAAGIAGLLVLGLYALARHRTQQLGKRFSAAHVSLYGQLEENLDNVRLVKSFGREAAVEATVARAFAEVSASDLAFIRQGETARFILQAGSALLLALLVWFAVGRAGVSSLVLLPMIALMGRIMPQLQSLQDSAQQFLHARPSVDHALALIRDTEAHRESTGPAALAPPFHRELRLEQVSFAFPGGRQALQRVDLAVAAGETLALVGHSGAGKSTLADIIGGLLAPDTGRLLIDGTPLDAAARGGWRQRVAYVHQDAVLFAGSVRDNLLWAVPDAGEAELEAALHQASALFVHALPGGLDCPLGERGRQLSGGERQRISLARALLRRPQLLILDEATSAVDAAAERTIAEAVAALKGQMTIVIIGHRGLLTDLADRSIVLEKGQLKVSG